MNINLFRLALERLDPSDWSHFEQICSAFLASEFSSLRTMANPAGDGGRDSELFSPDGKSLTAAQYSVASDWKTKIRNTKKRLLNQFPDIKMLIYMSNQLIGGQADDLKRELFEAGLFLDIRDRNWFLERCASDALRENAAQELIDQIALPYLVGEQVIDKPSSALTSQEAQAALLYLGLQWQDDISGKGLTKLSFDALVRAALRHTHSENRLSRSQIHDAINIMLPSSDKTILSKYVDSAISRLTKKYIRIWKKEDEFCLTHQEHQRITIRLAELENQEADFHEEVKRHSYDCFKDMEDAQEDDVQDLGVRIPRILEKILLKRGEAFVTTVVSGNLHKMRLENIADIIFADISSYRPRGSIAHYLPIAIETIVRSMLAQPTTSTQKYLRRLADSYTLLSFLNETPDVQSATRKLFSHGTIWLDTTVLLRIFPEYLQEDESQRRLTGVFKSCNAAGIELRVTTGIIQEINAHMQKSLTCSQYPTSAWKGPIPFLYSFFLQTGQGAADFRKWLSLFRGDERPEDDITQFLFEVFAIQKMDLEESALKVDPELRWAADRLWSSAHIERRRNSQKSDDATTQILIQHDIETYLGVIALRLAEQVTELGYRHWLLTLDKIAWEIRDRLRAEFPSKVPPSPLLSLSFLVNNLTFGPKRHLLRKGDEFSLPLLLDIEMMESLPHDIHEIADKVRKENDGLPEYVIRRRVRDAIDRAKRSRGYCDFGGIFDSDQDDITG